METRHDTKRKHDLIAPQMSRYNYMWFKRRIMSQFLPNRNILRDLFIFLKKMHYITPFNWKIYMLATTKCNIPQLFFFNLNTHVAPDDATKIFKLKKYTSPYATCFFQFKQHSSNMSLHIKCRATCCLFFYWKIQAHQIIYFTLVNIRFKIVFLIHRK